MRRGYIRPSTRVTEKWQREKLSAASKHMQAMLFDAVDALALDHRTMTTEVARKHGKKGGRPPEDDQRMAIDQARKEWMNTKANRTNADALARMPGWSQRLAYIKFGPRGTTLGGRPKKQR